MAEDEISQEPTAPSLWGYSVFFLLGMGSIMGIFAFIVSIDYYQKVFIDFHYLEYLFNLGFSIGGWVSSTFFALPLQSYIRPHKLMAFCYSFNFIVLSITIVLNWCCILPSVLEPGSSPHWAVMSLITISLIFIGITYGINASCVYSITNHISQSYTSAVMAGSASSGFIVSSIKVIAKGIASAIGSTLYIDMVSVIVFFSIGTAIQLICAIVSYLMIKMSFTRDVISRKAPVQEPTEIELSEGRDTSKEEIAPTIIPPESFTSKLKDWFLTLRDTSVASLGVFMTFFITYSLYPGLLTTFVSNMNTNFEESEWFVESLLIVYSFGDFLGRLLSVFRKFHIFGYKRLWLIYGWRILFFPLFILFIRFNHSVYDPFKFVAAFALSFSGGYYGSVSLMQGSALVKGRRYAGSTMTFALNSGIASGALFGVLLGYLSGLMPQS